MASIYFGLRLAWLGLIMTVIMTLPAKGYNFKIFNKNYARFRNILWGYGLRPHRTYRVRPHRTYRVRPHRTYRVRPHRNSWLRPHRTSWVRPHRTSWLRPQKNFFGKASQNFLPKASRNFLAKASQNLVCIALLFGACRRDAAALVCALWQCKRSQATRARWRRHQCSRC